MVREHGSSQLQTPIYRIITGVAVTDFACPNIACGSCEGQYGVNISGRICGGRFPGQIPGFADPACVRY